MNSTRATATAMTTANSAGLAAPVRIYSGQVVASLCTVGPKSRMTRQRLRDLRAPLLALAATVSERLGASLDGAAPRDAT